MKASRATFLYSALFATCVVGLHCGGDDTNSAQAVNTAGTPTNGGSGDNTNGGSGDNTNGGSGTNNNGTSGSNGNGGSNANAGTNNNGGTNGVGGTNGAGGSGNANNNAACPGAAPMDNDPCTEPADAGRNGLTCNYASPGSTTSCDCQQGNRQQDGGSRPSAWQCTHTTVRDAGGGGPRDGGGGGFTFDAAIPACPRAR